MRSVFLWSTGYTASSIAGIQELIVVGKYRYWEILWVDHTGNWKFCNSQRFELNSIVIEHHLNERVATVPRKELCASLQDWSWFQRLFHNGWIPRDFSYFSWWVLQPFKCPNKKWLLSEGEKVKNMVQLEPFIIIYLWRIYSHISLLG